MTLSKKTFKKLGKLSDKYREILDEAYNETKSILFKPMYENKEYRAQMKLENIAYFEHQIKVIDILLRAYNTLIPVFSGYDKKTYDKKAFTYLTEKVRENKNYNLHYIKGENDTPNMVGIYTAQNVYGFKLPNKETWNHVDLRNAYIILGKDENGKFSYINTIELNKQSIQELKDTKKRLKECIANYDTYYQVYKATRVIIQMANGIIPSKFNAYIPLQNGSIF